MATVSEIRDSALKIGAWPVWAKLIAVNVAVFVCFRLVVGIAVFTSREWSPSGLMSFVTLPSDVSEWLTRPWTLFTCMFVQYDVVHLIVNMLWLSVFGYVCAMKLSSRRILAVYIVGGVSGGVAYMILGAVDPIACAGTLTGASGAVMGIVGAVLMIMPDHTVRMVIFGDVPMKWIVVAAILLLCAGALPDNYASLAAHAGGFVAGVCMGRRWSGVEKESVKSSCGTSMFVQLPDSDEDALNILLDRVRKSGYSSLSEVERDRLFMISKRLKKDN